MSLLTSRLAMDRPSGEELKAAHLKSGLSQVGAAALMGYLVQTGSRGGLKSRTWQALESAHDHPWDRSTVATRDLVGSIRLAIPNNPKIESYPPSTVPTVQVVDLENRSECRDMYTKYKKGQAR